MVPPHAASPQPQQAAQRSRDRKHSQPSLPVRASCCCPLRQPLPPFRSHPQWPNPPLHAPPLAPQAVTQWERERLLLRRESSSGMYSVAAWFTAKTATVTPVQVAQTTAFCLVSYFMVGTR